MQVLKSYFSNLSEICQNYIAFLNIIKYVEYGYTHPGFLEIVVVV